MSYAALDAKRVTKAARASLLALSELREPTEAQMRKKVMVERMAALASAASLLPEGTVTLTSEEFWLISNNW